MSTLDRRGREYLRERMPLIGIGVYQIREESELRTAVKAAIECGYRFIDTAQVYRNEAFVARALADFLPQLGLTRADVFITSKLAPRANGVEAYEAVKATLTALNTDYCDLFLIHWPGRSGIPIDDAANEAHRREAWQALERAYDEGLVRAIGVSNFEPQHLEELMRFARVQPALNQCEFHPFYCPSSVVDACKQHDIHFQAYSSFGSSGNAALFEVGEYAKIAERHRCSVSQLLLAFSLCQGISVLPKSVQPTHIAENFAALSVKLMDDEIEAMKWRDREKKFCWDPRTVR